MTMLVDNVYSVTVNILRTTITLHSVISSNSNFTFKLGDQSIERLVAEGRVEGAGPCERSLTRWSDRIKSAVGNWVNERSRMTSNWQQS